MASTTERWTRDCPGNARPVAVDFDTITSNCIVFGNGVFRSSDRYRKTAKNCVGDDETAGTHASARTPAENWITTTGFFIRARPAMVRRLGGSSCGRVRWRIAIPRFRQHWLTLCTDDHTRAFVVNEPKTRSPRASLSVHRSGGYLPCVYNLRLCKLICFFCHFYRPILPKTLGPWSQRGEGGLEYITALKTIGRNTVSACGKRLNYVTR